MKYQPLGRKIVGRIERLKLQLNPSKTHGVMILQS